MFPILVMSAGSGEQSHSNPMNGLLIPIHARETSVPVYVDEFTYEKLRKTFSSRLQESTERRSPSQTKTLPAKKS